MRVAATGQAPPFAVWRLWLDRLVAHDRPAFLGTSGFGPLDNISVLERFEDGAHNWSAAHGGSVVELHAYALVEQPDDHLLKDRLLAELHRVYPELTEASIIAEEWLVNDDCPLLDTGPGNSGSPLTRPTHGSCSVTAFAAIFQLLSWSALPRPASLLPTSSSGSGGWLAMLSGRYPCAHVTDFRPPCTAFWLVRAASIVLAVAVLRCSDSNPPII